MEYCAGGSLYDIIQDCVLSVEEINCCWKQLINGVAYLHSMGVAHRDLKPGKKKWCENIKTQKLSSKLCLRKYSVRRQGLTKDCRFRRLRRLQDCFSKYTS